MTVFETIEGETPIDDISGLKVSGITTRKQLNEVEAQNIAKAVIKYFAAKPSSNSAKFNVEWSKKLHKEMFGDVWKWGGGFRKTDIVRIGSIPYKIQTDMSIQEQSARLHHIAVKIHPFLNGNGRWARMLGDIWLKMYNLQPIEWAVDIDNEGTARTEYLEALREADSGDYKRCEQDSKLQIVV